MNARPTPLRIVHACNFHYNRSGDKFDTLDQKIHQGFSENGHYIYPFPVHDIARQMSWTCSKNGGTKGANLALVETCRKIQPDILLLGHAQSITRQTLESIRNNQPTIKIAQWFCDWLYSKDPNSCESIFEKLDLLDSFFATTAGEKLAQFNGGKCRTAFFPNLVHPGIERHRSFEKKEHAYDIVFIGTDRKDPERTAVLLEIEKNLGKDFKVGIFGSLGRPSVFGHEKDLILLNSKASLNLTRLPEAMKWYSSDRIASLLGNGILTCTRSEADLHEIYGRDSMLYYNDTSDLVHQLHHQLDSGDWRATARNGWEKSHLFFNSRRITSLMIDFIDGRRDDCLGLNEILGNEYQAP